jgi:fumarate reductase subunit C
MLRELSAVFLALYVVVLLVMVSRVLAGEADFDDYVTMAQSPASIVFHTIALAFAVLHTVTWFQAVPKGLPIRRGEERVPAPLLIGANYGLLLAVSIVLILLMTVGD